MEFHTPGKKNRVEIHTVELVKRANIHTLSDEPINIVGPAVRRLRVERKMSQPELAAYCQRAGWDISRDIVARIEGGTRLVRDIDLVKLAAILGVSPNELLGVTDKKVTR